MCYIACKVCRKEGTLLCDECKHVEKIVDDLKQEKADLEKKISRIQGRVLTLLKSIGKENLEKPNTELDSKLLLELWEAAECNHHTTDPWRFLSEQLVEGWIICSAVELFHHSPRQWEYAKNNYINQLKHLEDAIAKSREFHGWSDERIPGHIKQDYLEVAKAIHDEYERQQKPKLLTTIRKYLTGLFSMKGPC